jgi:tripartite ATP-independent transporter DctM subunit
MAAWVGPLVMLIGFFLVGLAFGIPMAFVMGCGGILTGIVFYGPAIMQLALTNTWQVMNSQTMVACPMFIFMAIVLEKSGIADALYTALHQWLGGVRGGLACATVIISALLGAMSGVAAAGTVTMGLIALPIMLEKKYHKSVAIGPILVGGPLGILIPPSIGFIIYGTLTSTSVGQLFAGGIMPGVLLVVLYCAYILIRCAIRPQDGPSIPKEERVSFVEKLKLCKTLILPILIVLAVLGSIFLGIASPTESAAVGALGAIISSIIYRKYSWAMMREAAIRTVSTMGMVIWILFGAQVFSSVLITTGIPNMLRDFVESLNVNHMLIVFLMMCSYFILGCFLEETTMLFITIPIYMPILTAFGMDPIWFGVLFIISMQMAYITPPFGFSLFFLKGIAPKGVTTGDIYRAVPPFLILQWVAVLLCMFIPDIVMWLPNTLYGA